MYTVYHRILLIISTACLILDFAAASASGNITCVQNASSFTITCLDPGYASVNCADPSYVPVNSKIMVGDIVDVTNATSIQVSYIAAGLTVTCDLYGSANKSVLHLSSSCPSSDIGKKCLWKQNCKTENAICKTTCQCESLHFEDNGICKKDWRSIVEIIIVILVLMALIAGVYRYIRKNRTRCGKLKDTCTRIQGGDCNQRQHYLQATTCDTGEFRGSKYWEVTNEDLGPESDHVPDDVLLDQRLRCPSPSPQAEVTNEDLGPESDHVPDDVLLDQRLRCPSPSPQTLEDDPPRCQVRLETASSYHNESIYQEAEGILEDNCHAGGAVVPENHVYEAVEANAAIDASAASSDEIQVLDSNKKRQEGEGQEMDEDSGTSKFSNFLYFLKTPHRRYKKTKEKHLNT